MGNVQSAKLDREADFGTEIEDFQGLDSRHLTQEGVSWQLFVIKRKTHGF